MIEEHGDRNLHGNILGAKSFNGNSKVHSKQKTEQGNRKRPHSETNFAVQTSRLPIYAHREGLIDNIKKFQTTIVIGETGSGKSTQLPQYLANAFPGDCIVCTQPRRVAAITVAQRVANEQGCKLGEKVGYSIRFDDKTSARTVIKYATDGVLLRECMSDPSLSKYKVVVLDEAHERSIQTDILMGLLRQLQDKRPDLRIVIMSATLHAETFFDFFRDATLVTIPGRQYPVTVYYTKEPESDYVDAAMLTCLQIHEKPMEEFHGQNFNGVLVFLPGQDDIEGLSSLLEENLPLINKHTSIHASNSTSFDRGNSSEKSRRILQDFEIFPLYASMPPEEQIKAFSPSPKGVRKFVLATNIAETSVTISGIKYVVDTGFVKSRCVLSSTGMETLKVVPISKAQANQRAGRAGRECPGSCYRLYPEDAFDALEVDSLPEIQRVNIAQVILQLKVLKIPKVELFPFVSPPSSQGLKHSIDELRRLGALEKKEEVLTSLGKKMALLPLDPLFAHLLLTSVQYGCIAEMLTAVAMISTENIFILPNGEQEKVRASQAHRRFQSKQGDMFTLITIYDCWQRAQQDSHWVRQNYLNGRALFQAQNIRQQLLNLLREHLEIDGSISCEGKKEPFVRALANGLPYNIAQLSVSGDLLLSSGKSSSKSNTLLSPTTAYQTIHGNQIVYIHPSSSLFGVKPLPKYVVFAELLVTSRNYMRNVSEISESYLK